MLRARREGLLLALLCLATTVLPLGAKAQEPSEPPAAPAEEAPAEPAPAEEAPAQKAPAEKTPAEKTPAEDAPAEEVPGEEVPGEEDSDEIITKDADGKEWITPDVAGAEREAREDAVGDVDEVIIKYGASPDMNQDEVTDAEGKKIKEDLTPVVAKAVKVQDPDKLEPGADKETGVQGQVVSRRPKKVLPDAPVLAKGKDDGRLRTTLTDERGRYRLYLPPGKYTLRSYYDLYHGARWDNIAVTRGAFKRVNFVLDPISEKDAGVEEIEVAYMADASSEAAQLNIRKEAVTVQDSISAQEISRAGDSTAQGAVKRVVGVTVDEDGRIIIRGLSGRYNSILFNDIPVPSVDPDIPSVKLDIFPTDIVSNLSIIKVPRPDLPGNFAGGLLNIQTSAYPNEQMVKVGVGIGFNSLSAFKDMPSYQGGKRDWLGFDDGTRALPDAVGNNRLRTERGGRYQTPDQTAQVGRAFSNIWNPKTRTAAPKLGLKASAGNTYSLKKKDARAGYLVSVLYDYQDKIRNGYNRKYTYDADGNAIMKLEDYDFKSGAQEVLWATFGSGFVQLNRDNELKLNTFFTRAAKDKTLLQLGAREDNDILTTKNSYNFVGRSLFFNQLIGNHRNLGKTESGIEWNLVAATGKRDEPDRREIQQQVESQRIPQANRYDSDLGQLSLAGQSIVRFPAYEAFESRAYMSFGLTGGWQDREFTARRFEYRAFSGAGVIGDPEVVYGPDGMGRLSNVFEFTRDVDSYDAQNTLGGGFVQLETPMAPWLRFLGLLRMEVFNQQVQSRNPFGEAIPPEQIRRTNRTDIDPMPSANFAFTINEKMFVKLGYGMTVIRPAIRELAPYVYVDFLRGWNISGNPDLQRTQVQNVEARYEFFFGGTNLFAATAFYKYFKNPIEFVVINQDNSAATYANAESAWLAGGEVELRLGFGLMHEKLEKLYFLGNFAYMASQTRLPEGQRQTGRSNRPLYGQSPYVTNLSLRFDDPDSRVMVGLVYNAFGPRIVEVGTSAGSFNLPDVKDMQRHMLDLIATYKPNEHVKLGFKWKNIAFAKIRYQQANELVLLENLGTTVSVSAEYIY